MRYMRPWAPWLGLGVCALLLAGFVFDLGVGNAAAQPQPPIKDDPRDAGNGAKYSSVRIVEDANFRKIINVGRDCIEDKEWNQAVQALQAVLNEKQDHYVQDRKSTRLNSSHIQKSRMPSSA